MVSPAEKARRWRLILGADESEETGEDSGEGQGQTGGDPRPGQGPGRPGAGGGLSGRDQGLDEALEALYGDEGGLGQSAPDIARWLGDIRTYFPAPVAQLMQQDALKKLKLRQLLSDPEFLAGIEPDLDLVTRLLALRKVLPAETQETARQVVRQVVEELIARLRYPLRQAITGSLNRASRTRRPRRPKEVNWLHTIKANLKHYQPAQGTIIPETLVGYGKQQSSLREVILCLDQSGSMSQSVVYASIVAAVMASLPALATRLVAFDANVVDLTGQLDDPVALLFGIQLRGGTNIDQAVGYCQQLVTRPRDTILVLISDLFEGGNQASLLARLAELVANGVQVIVLLALNDQGAPRYNRHLAQSLAELGVPAFACTPDLFPDLMAAALNGQDIRRWAAGHDIVTAPSG
ncbi:MAG: VWA domain-containing protein [Anaerolineae bacterium]|nr:VWA domain-containing protein [Anaerolineae bacterium]